TSAATSPAAPPRPRPPISPRPSMGDFPGPLRIAGSPRRPAARRPGPAVLLVLLYAALFAAALWWLRAASPLFQRRPAVAVPPANGAKSETVSRSALLSGQD